MTEAPHRLAVRRAWVAAELAMAGGEGPIAVRHAEAAVELAARRPSVGRHRAKSEVVLAAALCSAGDVDRAGAVGAGGVASSPADRAWYRCVGRWRAYWSTLRIPEA